ncbi:alpha/beta fold hydrolase [Actinoplanes sp. NPDC049118]|uniref:alpha/beta hydrolase n=1 Tax=Actinoplanes sp. NPDC049118 TaxID=3155769 RepID=UPI0033D8C92B
MSSRLLRYVDWTAPVPAVEREVLQALPQRPEDLPPVLFVPGLGHGAWAFAEHWLAHTASRGFAAYSVSPRPEGSLRAYVHDVVQVAASLPRQAVLVGHGAGALLVSHALTRYPARAAVLAAPVPPGWASLGAALRANPFGTLPALFGAAPRLSRRQLFGADLVEAEAEAYRERIVRAPARVYRQVLFAKPAAEPVGAPPTLVVGSPDDRVVPRAALDREAVRFGGAPLLFPGMGHDLMLDTNWQEPIDAILDWLGKVLSA